MIFFPEISELMHGQGKYGHWDDRKQSQTPHLSLRVRKS